MGHEQLLKWLDRWLGASLVNLVSKPVMRPVEELRDVLIIRPGGIGDAVLLAPMLQSLLTAHPLVNLDVLCEGRNSQVFKMIQMVRKIYRYDDHAELRQVLKRSYDVIIDTEQWYRLSALVARIIRSSQKVGFATNRRGRMFTHPVPYRAHAYEADVFAELARSLDLCPPALSPPPFLSVPKEAYEKVKKYLGPLVDQPFLGIFPGGSMIQKRWPIENFRAITVELSAKGIPFVIVGGPEDRELASAIIPPEGGLSLTGELSLLESAAVIDLAKVFLSNDSGLLHMAVGLNTPALGLFGPSDSNKWGPRQSAGGYLQSDVECRPCSSYGMIPECSYAHCCMGNIEPDQVLSELMDLWTNANNFERVFE